MDHVWVIVLAGGEGSRVRALTKDARGRYVPKQFCRLVEGRTMLSKAIDRARQLAGERVLPVVVEHQRRWWEPELRDLPRRHTLVQSANRGTAVGVLQGLRRALDFDADAILLVIPSDQDVEDERALLATLRQAVSAAALRPDQVIVVGMESEADPEYGWIVPGEKALEGGPEEEDATLPVLAFLEKPAPVEMASLVRRRALCNTLILAATGRALLELYRRYQPELLEHAPMEEPDEARSACDFSREILERATSELRVLPGRPCGWSDLGTPGRLTRWLERHPTSPAVKGRLVVGAGCS